MSEIEVARRPRVAAIATGSELVAAGIPLEPGQIYESKTWKTAQALRCGAELPLTEVVRDDQQAIADTLERALTADVVISSGGVSVGPHDYVKPALLGLGVEEVFWRVAHKPGKPLWFGVAGSGRARVRGAGQPRSRASSASSSSSARRSCACRGRPRPLRPVARLTHALSSACATAITPCAARSRPGRTGMQLDPQRVAGVPSDRPRGPRQRDRVRRPRRGRAAEAGSLVEYVLL